MSSLLRAAARKMKILPVTALEDNYMYLVVNEANNKAFTVDPVEPEKIRSLAQKMNVTIEAALVTHHHWDHAGGMPRFRELYAEPPIYGGDDRIQKMTKHVAHGEEFEVGGMKVRCLSTPCHTKGHVCYFVTLPGFSPVVFTGDTLFIAGCGKFFEGTADQMHVNLSETLAALPDETQVFCGHEYTTSNLKFAHHIEPGNQAVSEKLAWSKSCDKNSHPTVPSTLGEEKQINPFMRVTSADIQKNVSSNDPVEVMKRLREAKNNFRAAL